MFRAWGRFIVAHPRTVLLASLACALLAIAGVARLRVDVTFESFLEDDDPVLLTYERFADTFGRDERIVVSAEPGSALGPDGVFERRFLEKLRALHEALEARVPHLEEITSLVNARDIRAEGDTLLVEEFLDPWPGDDAAIARLRARAFDNPLFQGSLISRHGEATAITLELQLYSTAGAGQRAEDELAGFDDESDGEPRATKPAPVLLSGEETAEAVAAIDVILAEFASPEFVLHSAGMPLILQVLAEVMARDMPRFLGLALVSIGVLLLFMFRRVVAALAPLAVVGLTVGATFGLMGWSGTPIQIPTQILPSLLLAACVGDSIHVLAIFYQRRYAGDGEADALVHALGHSGFPVVLTSLTTAVGLSSFMTSDLAPVSAIGVFAPIGVLIALFLTLTLLPAIIVLVPMGEAKSRDAAGQETGSDRVLATLGRFALSRPLPIVLFAGALAAVALVGALRLRLSHDPMTWFPDGTPIKEGTRHIDAVLGGSVSFEVQLERSDEGSARDPEALQRLAALGHDLETTRRDGYRAGQTVSLADLVKEIHRALHEDRDEAYVVPDDPDAVAQEMLLFESAGSDDLEDVVDGDARTLRMSVRMPWRDSVHYRVFFDLAERDSLAALAGLGETTVTGVYAVLVRSIAAVVSSVASSYLYSFGGIGLMMILLLGSVRWGLLAMIPNVFPILLTLGVMGYAGLPLDSFTLMIGAIALGICDDDTIHAWHHIRTLHRQGIPLDTAVAETLATTGRAALFTSILLAAGFIGFTLSSMGNLVNFGLLTTFTIGTALVSEIFLGPALLSIAEKVGALRDRRAGAGESSEPARR
ncbi:MAG: MMPL family transporter [Deltaproteobacteria bacterium]|nr:MMPL family transporter [Deltaproteobacteria bacterium]